MTATTATQDRKCNRRRTAVAVTWLGRNRRNRNRDQAAAGQAAAATFNRNGNCVTVTGAAVERKHRKPYNNPYHKPQAETRNAATVHRKPHAVNKE